MAWFWQKKNKTAGYGKSVPKKAEISAHFSEFVLTRSQVAGYFEEATPREPATLVLVALDGEWTRRPVNDVGVARKLCEQLEIPFYLVAQSGYPRAMREWNQRNSR